MSEPIVAAEPSSTVHDIARLLGVSARTVQRLAESRQIPSYRVGSLLRFDRSEVLAATRATESAGQSA